MHYINKLSTYKTSLFPTLFQYPCLFLMDSLLVKTTTPSSEPIIDDQATPLPQAKSPEVVVSDSGDRRLSRFGPRQVEASEQPPCPRCESTNTKFCYYNNYNLSQPRHFCKSCRRYWTRGGALRNVPVGGATRKPYSSNKRPRTTAAAASTSSSDISNTLVVSCNSDAVMGRTRAPEPVVSVPGLDPRPAQGAAVNLNLGKSGSSSCWWGTSASQMGALPFSGCGIGLGPVVGYEPGILDWPMEPVRVGNGGADLGCSTWEMGGDSDQGGDAAEVDYISWPELAVSTRAKALK